jgi:hypothetical protein
MPPQSKQRKYAYPWAELYEMESRIHGSKGGQGRIGQPSQLHIRRQTSLMLSDEELQSLYETMLSIQNALRPAKATKSQVDALAVRVLSARLKVLESESRLSSWDEVVKALIEGEME